MTENSESRSFTGWNCLKCNSAIQVQIGVKYLRCQTCGALFGINWRGGQIDGNTTKRLLSTFLDAGLTREELESQADQCRADLHSLNDNIRRLEMAKGGERFRILAIFVIICAAIYALFRVTVEGGSILVNPSTMELLVAGATAISFLVIAVFRLRKGALIRKVNRLLQERDAIDKELISADAALTLKFEGLHRSMADAQELQGEGKTDLISKFASRKKEGRKRLNIRDET